MQLYYLNRGKGSLMEVTHSGKGVVCSNHGAPQLSSVGHQTSRRISSLWNQILDFSSLGNIIVETTQNGLWKKVGSWTSLVGWQFFESYVSEVVCCLNPTKFPYSRNGPLGGWFLALEP